MKCNNREPGRGERREGHDPYISGLADKFHSRFAHKWARTCCSSLPTNWKLYCTHYSITSPSLLSPFTSQFVFINFAIFPTAARIIDTAARLFYCFYLSFWFYCVIKRQHFVLIMELLHHAWASYRFSRKTQVLSTSLYNVKQYWLILPLSFKVPPSY